MILKSNSVIGFNLYKRMRLVERRVVFESSNLHCDDIGLYVIGKYPNLEYNFVSLFQKKEWDNIAFDTLNLAMLNLIVSGALSLHYFEDKKSCIGGLFKWNRNGYFFKIEDISKDEDLLTKKILIAINKVEEKEKEGLIKDLDDVVRALLDLFLGKREEHNRPEKKFVIELLKRYSKKYNWIKIVSKKKMLGIYKDYKIEINPIYIPRIDMQHQDLVTYHLKQLRSNRDYSIFTRKLRDALDSDFKRRVPSDNGSD